jgi:hypothetical protein
MVLENQTSEQELEERQVLEEAQELEVLEPELELELVQELEQVLVQELVEAQELEEWEQEGVLVELVVAKIRKRKICEYKLENNNEQETYSRIGKTSIRSS